jgi:ketosteroid isomerase-like protein
LPGEEILMIPDQIRIRAQALDEAIEKRDVEATMAFFSDDFEIEMIGLTLKGREGLKKALSWMFDCLKEIRIIPLTILIDGATFFEEFVLRSKTKRGKTLEVRQAEVLIYDLDYKVKSLRLYFDRLELGEVFASNIGERLVVKLLARASVKSLQD